MDRSRGGPRGGDGRHEGDGSRADRARKGRRGFGGSTGGGGPSGGPRMTPIRDLVGSPTVRKGGLRGLYKSGSLRGKGTSSVDPVSAPRLLYLVRAPPHTPLRPVRPGHRVGSSGLYHGGPCRSWATTTCPLSNCTRGWTSNGRGVGCTRRNRCRYERSGNRKCWG